MRYALALGVLYDVGASAGWNGKTGWPPGQPAGPASVLRVAAYVLISSAPAIFLGRWGSCCP